MLANILTIIVEMFTGGIFCVLTLLTYDFYYLNIIQLIVLSLVLSMVSFSYISLFMRLFHINAYISSLLVIIIGLFIYKVVGGNK